MRPVLFLSLVCVVSSLGIFAVNTPVQSFAQTPTVESESIPMGEPSAKSLKEFRSTILKAGEQAVKAGELSRLDLMRLRLATMAPRVLEQIHQAAAEQVLSDGLSASYGAIDWTKLLAFVKELIPLILELIKLFS